MNQSQNIASGLAWLGLTCLLLPVVIFWAVLAVALNPAMALIGGGLAVFVIVRSFVRRRKVA